MVAALPVVPVHTQPFTPRFRTFHDGKELEPWLTVDHWAAFNVKQNMSTAVLFAEANRSQQPFVYFSADLDKLVPLWPALAEAVAPHTAFLIAETGVQRNLWLGRKGTITAMHQDASWNVFVQLHGRKRFTLVAPWANLCSYPCLHPSIAHSQVDPDTLGRATLASICRQPSLGGAQHEAKPAPPVLAPNRDAGEDAWLARLEAEGRAQEALSCLESPGSEAIPELQRVELAPGDALLVPPYFWHQVLTLEDSISFNVWSDAPEYNRILEDYALPLELRRRRRGKGGGEERKWGSGRGVCVWKGKWEE